MKRTGLLLLTLLCMAPLAGAQAVTLKSSATVASGSIMLSDIFLDIPFEKDQVVASAPPLGRSVEYNTRDLVAISARHKLDWQATGGAAITITRASQQFDARQIADAATIALNATNSSASGGRTEIRLDNELLALQAPVDKDVTLTIDNLNLMGNKQRFTAVAKLMSEGQAIAQLPISGRVRSLVSVPVVGRALRKGDIIAASDLAWQDMEISAENRDILMDADDLLGKTPRTNVRPGLPIRAIDLLAPTVVTKGSLVTLIYEVGSMKISAEGRALADAAAGDTARVMNLRTSRTIEGVAIRSGVVRVGPTTGTEMQLDRTAMN